MKKLIKWLCIGIIVIVIIGAAMSGGDSKKEKKDIVSTNGTTVTGENTNKGDTEETHEVEDTQIGEQVLLEQNGIRIIAKEYVDDSIFGEGIKLQIENTSNIDLTVGCDALIVNDYMITDLFSSKVTAGKTSNETMYLLSDQLEAAGIENVGKVEIYFRAYDDEYNNIFENVYAMIQTSSFAEMDTTPNDGGIELYNAGGIRIVGQAVDEDSFWGAGILLYCENNSDKNVNITAVDVSINGIMIESALFSNQVYAGKRCVDDITLFSSALEENGITSIDNVELKFHISNINDYSDLIETDTITFSTQTN